MPSASEASKGAPETAAASAGYNNNSSSSSSSRRSSSSISSINSSIGSTTDGVGLVQHQQQQQQHAWGAATAMQHCEYASYEYQHGLASLYSDKDPDVAAQQQQPQPQQATRSQKPKRKRVASQAQRKAANVRERRRMYNLNEAFDTLRTKVPTFAFEKRLSRIETLKLAITYIRFMGQVVRGVPPGEVRLRSASSSHAHLPTAAGSTASTRQSQRLPTLPPQPPPQPPQPQHQQQQQCWSLLVPMTLPAQPQQQPQCSWDPSANGSGEMPSCSGPRQL